MMFTTKKQLKRQIAELQSDLASANRKVSVAEYTNARYRRTIENLTGKKFVFGFNPNDRSMLEGMESTYGWFIPMDANYGTYTKAGN